MVMELDCTNLNIMGIKNRQKWKRDLVTKTLLTKTENFKNIQLSSF